MKGLLLAIETSNPSAWTPESSARPGVALVAPGGEVLGVEHTDPTLSHHDDLMATIDRLFRGVGRAPKELGGVAVSCGPGGFTAVRLAVTTAKMICEATGAECLAVPSAWVAARRVVSGGRSFGVALASKGDTAFLTAFDAQGKPKDQGRLVGVVDLAVASTPLLVVDRFLPQGMRVRCAELGIEVIEPTFDPVACAEASVGVSPVDPVALLPMYPREPEAVTKWRLLHPGG